MRTSAIYTRVSSVGDRQNTKRQVIDLTSYASSNDFQVMKVFEEHISGATKNKDRAVLEDCLTFCFDNSIDCLLVSELSRLGRNVWEVQENVKRCIDANLDIYFQKERLHLFNEDGSLNPFANIMISVLGTCAQMEREAIYFRLKSGRDIYKKNGGTFGRPSGTSKTKEQYSEQYPNLIAKLKERAGHLQAGIRDKDDSLRTIASNFGVSVPTISAICKVFGF